MLNIRLSRLADGPRAVEIWHRAVDATHHFLRPADHAAIAAQVQAFLPAAPLWLATDEHDQPLGFMLLDGARMEALFIDPAHHGRGIGRALVEHALSLHPLLLTDVNEQNTQAARFYERLGFVATGRSPCDAQGRPYPLIHLQYAAPSASSPLAPQAPLQT